MSQRRYSFLIATLAIVCSLLFSLPALADSHARIVRLSYIDGDAQISHQNQGFTHAVLNMPVTEGMWLYTPNRGRAEVQFENGSTVRLVDDAQIQFEKLALSESGGKINAINIDHGVAYFNFDKVKNDDQITIKAGDKVFCVTKSSHLRVDADHKNVQFAVFHGEGTIDAGKRVEVKSNETLTLPAAAPEEFKVAKDVDKLGSDSWDKDRDHSIAMLDTTAHSNGYNYSYPDAYSAQFNYLGAYGNYYNAPGYGTFWQPYGMGPGWDPFMNGLWGFYPGYGYMWISSYPWGWGPYRYGQWQYIPSYGWGWIPGTNFTTWNVGPQYGVVPTGWRGPVAPVVATGAKPASMVVVGNPPNVHPAVLSGKAYVGAHPDAAPVIAKGSLAGKMPPPAVPAAHPSLHPGAAPAVSPASSAQPGLHGAADPATRAPSGNGKPK